jgi:hypothetical protein
MTSTDEHLSISLSEGRVLVRDTSAVDARPYEESIELRDVVRIVLERGGTTDGDVLAHWFLQHREGWTLHFNDSFRGAAGVIRRLQALLGFAPPQADGIAGPGGNCTVVWSAA